MNDPEYYIAIHELIKLAKFGFTSIKQNVIGKINPQQNYNDGFVDFVLNETINEYKIETTHSVLNNKNIVTGTTYFNLKEQESAGTQKFFALAGSLLYAIRNKQIIWADELDSKFHPILFETIIKFFNSNKFNNIGAQLVFTTHSTHLLKDKILRRDQIVTVDKNEFGESSSKGLHTTNIRIDASHEKDYLSGKYGGVQKIDLENSQLDLFS